MARIADFTVLVTLPLPVETAIFNDFGRSFYTVTGHHRNPWLALTEPLGSVETSAEKLLIWTINGFIVGRGEDGRDTKPHRIARISRLLGDSARFHLIIPLIVLHIIISLSLLLYYAFFTSSDKGHLHQRHLILNFSQVAHKTADITARVKFDGLRWGWVTMTAESIKKWNGIQSLMLTTACCFVVVVLVVVVK